MGTGLVMSHIQRPVVSVILCTYSETMYEHFCEAAESVLAQSYDRIELVVVVDGSVELFDRVEQEYGNRDDVILHLNDENLGLLLSRNKGVELATGDIVAFIDDDAVADEYWVENLVETYRETNAVAAGGKMLPAWVADKPTFLPEEFYWLVGVTHKGYPDDPAEVRNTFGSNLSFRRDIFLRLGGFNPDIGGRTGESNFQGGETELCARLRAEYGRGVMYNPEARVAHKVFDFRTQPRWLLDRAFWQGYSKRAMTTIGPDDGREEGEFLTQLIVEFLPGRLRGLLRKPSIQKLKQLATLLILTGAVGAGYLYGIVKW